MSNNEVVSTSDIHPFFERFINTPYLWSCQRLIWQPKKQAHRLTYCRKKPEHEDYEPLGLSHIRNHIQPSSVSDTLSVAALDEVFCCKWCCWDFDANEPGGEELVSALKELGLNPVREGGRGERFGHVWLFFSEPVPALELAAFSRAFLAFLGLNPAIEFFPKQSPKERNKIGLSSVRLPLGIHNKPGAGGVRGWFEDAPRDISAQLDYINRQPYDAPQTLKKIGQMQQAIEYKEDQRKALQEAQQRAERAAQNDGKEPVELIDLLTVFEEHELTPISSDWFSARCPACAAEGKDTAGDNLNINRHNGKWFKCWEGGDGHSSKEIVKALDLKVKAGGERKR